MRIDDEVDLDDGLTVRVIATRCGRLCHEEHLWVVLGWKDADRWCALDSVLELDVEDDDDDLTPDAAEAALDERDRHSLMLWGVSWDRMSHSTAYAQVAQGDAMILAPGLWEEFDLWPEETIALLTRMRPFDFGAPCALLAYTRAYRRDLGGTRGVIA